MKTFKTLSVTLLLLVDAGAVYLLLTKNIGGPEFVAFFLGVLFLCSFIVLGDKIKEFTVAGNSIKLQEVTVRAEDVIARFERINVAILRNFLSLLKKQPGGFASVHWTSDPRIKDFWDLLEDIEANQLKDSLKSDILDLATYLLPGQYHFLQGHIDGILPQRPEIYPSPDEVLKQSMTEGLFQNIASQKNSSPEECKDKFLLSFREYEKLFSLIQALKTDN